MCQLFLVVLVIIILFSEIIIVASFTTTLVIKLYRLDALVNECLSWQYECQLENANNEGIATYCIQLLEGKLFGYVSRTG